MQNQVEIRNCKFEKNEFIKLNLLIFYSKPISFIFIFIGLMAIINLFSSTFTEFNLQLFVMSIVMILVALVLLPYSIIAAAKKNYISNKWIAQSLTYILNNDSIHIIGETFEHKTSWLDITLIKEYKNCYALYTSKNTAFFIIKRCFKYKEDEITLRRIFQNHTGRIKIKLK